MGLVIGILSTKIFTMTSKKHHSPFRYPGGKTWLVPFFRQCIHKNDGKPGLFIEPYAGGGSVGLAMLFENRIDKVVFSEIDPNISAVWETMLSDDSHWLMERIADFDFTRTTVKRVLNLDYSELVDIAFQTIVRNRASWAGIMTSQAGLINSGENGKGIGSRWYPETLCQRIQEIYSKRDQIEFFSEDGAKILSRYSKMTDVFSFVDPPYTAGKKKTGRRLYDYSDIDHVELFLKASSFKGKLIMTYEYDQKVIDLAKENNLSFQRIEMQNGHNSMRQELIISNFEIVD